MLLVGGPADFALNEAVSFVLETDDQAETDDLWDKLTADGGEPGPCGWLKDRYGFSWQIVPVALREMVSDPDPQRSQPVMAAMLRMGKIDEAELRRVYDATAPAAATSS